MSRQWTDEQRELFERAGGSLKLPRVAVSADAGAGKTSVLVERVRALPSEKRVLCVSFTEKSKADLEQRLADLAHVEVYTIHGFCGRIVSEFGAQLGLPPFFRIADSDERDEAFYRAFEKVYRRAPPKAVDHRVDKLLKICLAAHEAGEGVELHDGAGDADLDRFVREVVRDFESSKRMLRMLEYSDLELFAGRLLKRPEVISALRGRYGHVFVDEFQDTSRSQCELVDALCGKDGPVFVVGDQKQSIYRFRGADVSVFRQFVKTLPAQRRLSSNFRSHSEVIDMVNAVCAPIIEDYEPMTAGRPAGHGELAPAVFESLPRIARVTSETDADGIEAVLLELKARGVDWSQVVLLLRQVRGNVKLFEELSKRGIGVAVTSSSSASSNEDLQKLLNLWIWACEPWQRMRAAQVATDFESDARHRLEESLAALRSPLHETQGMPLNCEQLLARLDQQFGIKEKFGAVFEQFEVFVLKHQGEGLSPAGLARRLHHLLTNGQDISGFVLIPPPANLTGTVRVLTVHSAKGLEFPVVLLADVKARRKQSHGLLKQANKIWIPARDEDGDLDWSEESIKAAKSFEEQQETEESARLLYVALTRAQEALYVIDRPPAPEADAKKPAKKKVDVSWSAWLKEGISKTVPAELFHKPATAQVSLFDKPKNAERAWCDPLESCEPVYSKARIGVTELAASIAATQAPAVDFGQEAVEEPRKKIKFPKGLTPEQARDIGIELHACLERENFEELRATASRHGIDLEPFWQWLGEDQAKQLFDHSHRSFPEFAFEWKGSRGTVTGRIDRLVVTPAEAVIVDYKILLHVRTRADLLATYAPQLQIYAEAVKTLTNLPVVRAVILDVAAATGRIYHEVLALRP